MRNPSRLFIIMFLALGLFSLYGCGSMFPIQCYSIQTAQGTPSLSQSRKISLYELETPVVKPYAVLGKVMAFKRGGLGAVRDLEYKSSPPKDMVKRMVGPAEAMGANAIIGIYHGEYRGVNVAAEYVSGLAVQVLAEARGSHSRPADLRVGILPVQTGKADIREKKYAIIDRDLRTGARWFLEDKGYYAPLNPAVRFTGNIKNLESLDQTGLDNLYGSETELLLLIELIDEQALVPVLVEYRTVVLKTTLFSKSLGQAIWQNQIKEEKVAGVFWTWMLKAVTRAAAIEKVLKPLPFFSRTGSSEFVAHPPDFVKKKIGK